MSEGILQRDVSRRNFLKGSAAGAFALAAGAGMTSCSGWLAETDVDEGSGERTAYLCHQFHCLSGCSLQCTIRDERLVLVEPNDNIADEKHHNICLRGISEVQHVYSADRIQTPLKRVGERGEGKFVQISWDEAIQTIADAIKESQSKYGEGSVFIRKSTEASIDFNFITPILHADQGGNWGLDRGSANGITPILGPYTYCPTRSIWEFKDAATIIELGHNPLESGICWARALMDAKEAGTYIVCVDPRFSGTASKADQWLPVNPGTDAALVQGMIRVIVDNGWYDEEFIAANTSAGWLVDVQTGEVLRDEEQECPNPYFTGEMIKKPYVIDSVTGQKALYDVEGVAPAITGTYQLDGKTYTTQWELMKKWISGVELDWAAEKSGIDAQVITDLADRYANNGPAIIDFGLGGPDKYTNADVLGHSMAILCAITGNFGKKGAGFGFYGGAGPDEPYSTLGGWALPEDCAYGDSGIAMYDYPYVENNIHCAVTFGDAFTLEAGNANVMLEWVKGLDFFAQIDIYHSSSIDYADIVLPACSKFECEENVRHVRDSHGFVSLASGMLQPLFESKSDLQIERLLCAQFGKEGLLPETYEELARTMLEGLKAPESTMKDVTFESLLETGVAMIPGTENWFPDGYADQVYGTSSTKIELYTEQLVDQGHAWPVYEEANEAFEGNPLKETYPLYFTQGKTRYRIHAYYSASQWFAENYEPCVNISPVDAEARGISNNDEVRVFNDRGSFVCTARVNEGLKPGVLFMAETTYTSKYIDGFLQNVTNDARNERCYVMLHGPQIPYNDTLVQVEKA